MKTAVITHSGRGTRLVPHKSSFVEARAVPSDLGIPFVPRRRLSPKRKDIAWVTGRGRMAP